MPDTAIEFGLAVPTTDEWDVAQIYQTDVNSQEFKELLVRLYQNLSNMALVLNLKESAYYDTKQFVNGQQFFPNPNNNSSTNSSADFRPVFRLVVNFGALPNAGTKSVPHGLTITSGYTFTRIYGAASDTTGLNYIPIPYASTTVISPILSDDVEVKVDATTVTIITGSNRSNFNICYVVLEFMKF